MTLYNLMTCAGWEATRTGWMAGGTCAKSRIGLVLLFFILAIARKWGAEEWGIEFSFIGALVAGLLSYILLVTFLGSFKIALLLGIVIGLAGGYGTGFFFGEGGGYDE